MSSDKYRRSRRCHLRGLRQVAAVSAACVVMAACSTSSGGSAPTASGSGEPEPTAAVAQPQDASGSPLSAYFPGWNGAGQNTITQEQAAKSRAQELQVQQVIADCMARQGFSYTPWVSPVSTMSLLADAPAQGTMEYAQTYGLGIIDNPLTPSTTDAPIDPNETYKNGLSPSARYAFNSALDGKSSADIARGYEEGNPVPKNGPPLPADSGGCRGEAELAVYPRDDDDDAARALYGAAKLAVSNIDSDPQVVEALQKWSACMIDKGFPRFDRRVDVFNYFMSQIPGLDRSDGGAVAAFKAAEAKAAVDDLSCADTSGYADSYDNVRNAIERKFIADHQAELDAYVAKYGNR